MIVSINSGIKQIFTANILEHFLKMVLSLSFLIYEMGI